MDDDHTYLTRAIALSAQSVVRGAYPVGALVVRDGVVLGEGISDGKRRCDPTSHAEVEAIRAAASTLGARNLTRAVLYSSMEPCLMCFAASFWAYIARIVYAIPKAQQKAIHFEGPHDLVSINAANRRQIELVHIPELEKPALDIVTQWESRS